MASIPLRWRNYRTARKDGHIFKLNPNKYEQVF